MKQRLNDVFAALADPVRRAVVVKLQHSPKGIMTMSQLAKSFNLTRAGFLKHVRVLKNPDLYDVASWDVAYIAA